MKQSSANIKEVKNGGIVGQISKLLGICLFVSILVYKAFPLFVILTCIVKTTYQNTKI